MMHVTISTTGILDRIRENLRSIFAVTAPQYFVLHVNGRGSIAFYDTIAAAEAALTALPPSVASRASIQDPDGNDLII